VARTTALEIRDVLAELDAALEGYHDAVADVAGDDDLLDSCSTTSPEACAAGLLTLASTDE
jgi:hypothetical protein